MSPNEKKELAIIRITTVCMILALFMVIAIMSKIEQDRKNAETVYVVTQDWYGSFVYLVGVFDTEEEANAVVNEEGIKNVKVTEILKGQAFTCEDVRDTDNKYYLGGNTE